MTASDAEGASGRYSLGRLLGRGSLAETYLGEERASGKPIVLKLFTGVRLEKERLRVVETLRTYAQVLHPGLVRVLEVGLRNDSPFVVTEYARSGSLRQRYPQGTRLRPEILLPAVSQVGTALQHLHRQGLFHLDLKPENILLKDDGSLMLSDAGFLSLPALWQDRLAAERDSAAYLAPEQIMGLPVAASDQYALACLIYEWLSGHPPFIGSFREICAQHLHAPPPPLVAPVPEELKGVLRRALEKDPGKRFPTIQAFIEACILAVRGTASQPAAASVITGDSSPTPRPAGLPPAPSERVLYQQEGQTAEEQISRSRLCRLCRQPLPATSATLACPSCGYPSDLQEEQRFLEQLLAELSRLAQAGAASMRLGELASLSVPSLLALRREVRYGAAAVPLGLAIDRYWRRLLEVRQLLASKQLPGPSTAPSKAQTPQRTAAPPAISGAAAAAPGQPASQQEAAELDDTLVRKALQARREPAREAGAPLPGSAPAAQAEAPAAGVSPAGEQQEQVRASQGLAPEVAQSPAPTPGLRSAPPPPAAPAGERERAGAAQSPRQAPEPVLQAPATSAARPQAEMRQPLGAVSRSAAQPAPLGRPPLPPRPPRPPRPSPVTTLRPLIESPTALMVALGTFLLLAALLVFHIAQHPFALPVTICAQGFFALMVVITGRSRHFREFRGIYALFFALTVPLLFPDLNTIFMNTVFNGTPWLLALTALYGAVTYGVLAVSQRFSPFAILCAVALVVADVSLVWAIASLPPFSSSQTWGWWVASGLLVLALIEAEALGDPRLAPGGSPLARLLQTSWDVLRAPLAFSSQLLAYMLSGLAGLLSFLLLLLLLILQPKIYYSSPIPLPAFPITLLLPAFPITLLLALAWFLRVGARLRRSSVQYPLLALITLVVPLICSLIDSEHARLMSSLGLLLLATGFEGYARLAAPSLWLYLRPGRELTTLRFLLLLLVPFLAILPSQAALQQAALQQEDLLPGSLIVFASAALLLLMTLFPAPEAAAEGEQLLRPKRSSWLQVLAGSLFVWGYVALGQGINWASIGPLWWLGLLCGGLLALSALLRPLTGRAYAAPWEVVTLAVAILILILLPLQQDLQAMTLVPLLLGAAGYALLVAQRRSLWLFLPGLFLVVGLSLLGLWIAAVLRATDAWAVVLLASSVLLPPVAATLRRFLPAGSAALPRLAPQDWQAERLFTFWEWDWPLTTVALGTSLWLAVLLLVDWANNPSSPTQWHWSGMALAPLAPSLAAGPEWLAVGEALIMALAAYLAGLWGRTRLWLVPAALLALAALWLVQATRYAFVALTAVVVGTAAVGMLVSRLRGRRWAVPWYVAGLFSLLLVMWHALPPLEDQPQAYSAFVLLGLAGVVTVVGLVEKLPEALWLVPLLLLEGSVAALLSAQRSQLPNALLVLGQVPLSALLGLGLSAWQSRSPQAEGRLWRWRWALPWYTAGLVSIGATSLALFANVWASSSPDLLALARLGPYLLLAFAGLATAVALLEQAPGLLWLVPILVLEVSSLILPDLLLAQLRFVGESVLPLLLVPGCALVALALSCLGDRGREQRLLRASPWYTAALLALGTVSIALFSGTRLPWQQNPYVPLGYAGLATAIGALEGFPEILWLVPLLLLEGSVAALLPAQRSQLPNALLVLGQVPLSALLGLGLSAWQSRSPQAEGRLWRWRWALPWYTAGLVSIGATSLALFANLWTARLLTLAQLGPYVLLAFAGIATAVALLEQAPGLLWLVPILVLEVSSLILPDLLLAQLRFVGESVLPLLLVPGCALVALALSRLGDQSREQRLLRAGPWYTAALLALGTVSLALFSGGTGVAWWQNPYLPLAYAGLATAIGALEGLPEALWLVPLLLLEGSVAALLPAQRSQLPSALLVLGQVPLSALLGLGLSAWQRRSPQAEGRLWRWRWALPWYTAGLVSIGATSLALFARLWAPIHWPGGLEAIGLPTLTDLGPYVLLAFAGIATAVSLLEQAPAPLWLVPMLVLEVCSLILQDLTSSSASQLRVPVQQEGVLLLLLVPGCALVALALSCLGDRGREQRLLRASPWYTAALLALGAASAALFTPPLSWLQPASPYLLLGFGALSVLVALAEALPEVLWLVPLLTVLATLAAQLAAQRQLGPALLPPGLVLLCTLVALGTSHIVQERLPAARADRLRLRLGAPWYVTATFAACATPTFPFVRENLGVTTVAILLLVYALLAFIVAVGERRPLASLATSIFGLWGLGEITGMPVSNQLLLPVGVGALAVAFLTDRLLRSNPSGWSPQLARFIRPSWALAWVPLIVLTWSVLGLFHPHPWPIVQLPAADSWGPALAALLIYGSGLLLRQVTVCWLSMPLALSSIVAFSAGSGQGGPDIAGLALFCLLCTIGLACGAFLERHWPVRAYVFPLLAANCSGVLAVGIAGTLTTDQNSVLAASALLLGYGLLIWLLALGLRLPLLTLLTGLWTAWGLILLVILLVRFQQLASTKDQILAIIGVIGVIATLLGLLGLGRRPAHRVSWQRREPSAPAPRHEEKGR